MALEDDMSGRCCATVKLASGVSAEGKGVGQVDAIFDALRTHYANKYSSLRSIKLYDFNVKLNRKAKQRRDGGDAVCKVSLEIQNSRNDLFDFVNSSRSLAASSALAVAAAVEFFINSEKAFVVLYGALANAKERNRQDLVVKYTSHLASVVKNTSYAEMIAYLDREESL